MTTTIIVPASETSSAPGRIGTETTIARNRVLPAKTVVRPAVRRVFAGRLEGRRPLRQLFPEAGDHQQRVVDPQG